MENIVASQGGPNGSGAEVMPIRNLYEGLRLRHGERSDPDGWWPIYCRRTDPPRFERAITNILVQNSSWGPVHHAVESLDQMGLLTTAALAQAPQQTIAECIKPTGLQLQKAARLHALGEFVVGRFGTERAFCDNVTRAELLAISGIGEQTADRMILYTCNRLAWPVDTYCLRVLSHHRVIRVEPRTASETRCVAEEIRRMVEQQIPQRVEDWQRLHALMQLEGERLRKSVRASSQDD